MTGPSDGIMSDENQGTMARLRADRDWLARQGADPTVPLDSRCDRGAPRYYVRSFEH